MRARRLGLLLLVSATAPAFSQAPAALATDSPKDRVDARTEHRVTRISAAMGMASLYFHQNAFAPQGDTMLISIADGTTAIDLTTRQITRVTAEDHPWP